MKLGGAFIVVVKNLYTEYLIKKANRFQSRTKIMVVIKQ